MRSLFSSIHLVGTAVLMTALSVFSIFGCSGGKSEYRSVDLITAGLMEREGSRLRPEEAVAADETWVSVTLAAGDMVRAEISLFHEPEMRVAGILECGADSRSATGSLDLEVRAHDKEVRERIRADAEEGWWRRHLELSAVAYERVELEMRVAVPEGCVLRLREASIHQSRAIDEVAHHNSQVVLISVDTLRRDAVGVLDGAVATPELDRFAAEAERWTNAYAAASWTKPSHATLLTGFHADTHRAIYLEQPMDSALPTLAERFRRAGYTTAGLVYDCTWLSPRWGFGKGFDEYRVTRWRAEYQARQAANWILDHREEDFFFFLHTFEPHADLAILPYEAPGINRRWIAKHFGARDFGCRQGNCAAKFVTALSTGNVPELDSDRAILRTTYDEGVRYTDKALGELFDTLRRSGVWDDLVVVVTSDHGEEFAEHGGYGHHTVYEEILRVPLIIKWARGARAGEVNHTPCSAVDIAPTLLQSCGLPIPDLPGVQLHRRKACTPVLAGTVAKAVISRSFKGVFDKENDPRVFDLASDPGEMLNLAGSRPELVARLRAILDEERRQALDLHARLGSGGTEAQVVLSERDRRRLEAFGYLQ